LASHLDPDALSIPTRDQLAVTIPGTEPPVQAWAWENADMEERLEWVRYTDNAGYSTQIPYWVAKGLHLNTVSADQFERHYDETFLLEE
jgi:hypothetical protein